MSELSGYVLEAIRDQLQTVGDEIVGKLELYGDMLTACEGQMLLQAEVRSDAGYHPSIAHCHVITRIGNTSLSEPLDACVIGIHGDRKQGIALAAQSWVTNVGSALFSLMRARPLMGAAHFNGNDPWGVPGCHGFVGPVFGYNAARPVDVTPLVNAGMFDYAAAMAPPGLMHLAKVVLVGQTDRSWTRTLEIDGHVASCEEKGWECGTAAEPNTIMSQFAVFHYADQADAVASRQRVDDAIRRFVSAFAESKNADVAATVLREEGFDSDVIHRVVSFVPMAFFQVLFAGIGVKFSTEYRQIKKEGICETHKAMREPAFARAVVLCRELSAGVFGEAVKRLSMCCSTFNAVNKALHSGSKPENLILSAAIVPDADADAAAIQKALAQLKAERPPAIAPAAPEAATKAILPNAARPWWKFW